jgi:hypothetical protein
MADFDAFEGAKESEYLEQIDHHRNHNNRVQDAFDFAVHGNVGVYQPEEYSDNDQYTDDINERHWICSSDYPHLKRFRTNNVPFGSIDAGPGLNPRPVRNIARTDQSCSVSDRGYGLVLLGVGYAPTPLDLSRLRNQPGKLSLCRVGFRHFAKPS